MAGKGGVGKTTVAAALARAAADAGLGVVAVGIVDDAITDMLGVAPSALPQLLGERTASGSIRTAVIDPEEALDAHLADNDLGSISRRLSRTGLLELVAAATPGIRELLVLGRLRQLEQATGGLIIVDAPATGHATGLLRSPQAVASMARKGRIRDQADQAIELLGDPTRAQVVLVTVPEHTPVTETVETAFALEEEVGVALGPVIVNRCAPPSPPCRPPTVDLLPSLDPAVAQLIDDALDEDHIRHVTERENVAALRERSGLRCIELPGAATPSGGVDLGRLAETLADTR